MFHLWRLITLLVVSATDVLSAIIPNAAVRSGFPELTLRPAILDDLEAITEIMVLAFVTDPQTEYMFPNWRQYPEEPWNCTRETVGKFLASGNNGSVYINVITSPSNEDPSIIKPIAIAGWRDYRSFDRSSEGEL
jgi:hypothetical protein